MMRTSTFGVPLVPSQWAGAGSGKAIEYTMGIGIRTCQERSLAGCGDPRSASRCNTTPTRAW